MFQSKNVTGKWRGTYNYAPTEGIPEQASVGFTLSLKQGWFGHFTGTVTENAPDGTPRNGAIVGYLDFPRIHFKKRMAVGYIIDPEGRHITLRQSLIAQGISCEKEIPGAVIDYQGEFGEAKRATGSWIINAQEVSSLDGLVLPIPQMTGVWNIEIETVLPQPRVE